jgi:hypothetical protein
VKSTPLGWKENKNGCEVHFMDFSQCEISNHYFITTIFLKFENLQIQIKPFHEKSYLLLMFSKLNSKFIKMLFSRIFSTI